MMASYEAIIATLRPCKNDAKNEDQRLKGVTREDTSV